MIVAVIQFVNELCRSIDTLFKSVQIQYLHSEPVC